MATDIIARGMASKSNIDVETHTNNNDIHVTASDKSNWNNKLDKNQGSENSGKVLGTNANGEVIPLNGYGFEYDEETKMLKYGTDPTTNLNQGIGLDDTLSKRGYAADAGAVGELKSDLGKLKNGEFKKEKYVEKVTDIRNDYYIGQDGTIGHLDGYGILTFAMFEGETYEVTCENNNVLRTAYNAESLDYRRQPLEEVVSHTNLSKYRFTATNIPKNSGGVGFCYVFYKTDSTPDATCKVSRIDIDDINIIESINTINDLQNQIATTNTEIDDINKSLSCESLIDETDNLLTDSIFNNSQSGLTKNGIEFNFNNAMIFTNIANIFNEFILTKGEYSLLIGSENKLSNNLHFALQNHDASTNINVKLNSGTNSSIKHFYLENDVTFSNCGFYGYTTSYKLTGKIRLALVKGNADGFSYKINDEIELLKSEIGELKNGEVKSKTLIWEDDFDGESLDESKWNYELGHVRNNELQFYTKENVIVEDGCAVITAKKESKYGYDWTSSSITTMAKKNFQYGKIEAKMKLPNIIGSFPAFWMLGNTLQMKYFDDGTPKQLLRGEYPECGEVDIMEQFGTSAVTGGEWKSDGSRNGTYTKNINTGEFHVYGIEWDESTIKYLVDDEIIGITDITEELMSTYSDHPFYIILNLAVGASGGTPSESTNEMKMYIDWVRVWA